ncbi:MAG TPA: TonB C-terminal domain-containing protein [Candidatus Sulfotelmatobacter sp.]|jgi:TonB family protein|nr:TonB C-terminal domain-containing protein [Candidatus Sulfotelmatobacter sp.]
MIPRTLVPVGARMSAENGATTRRRPTTLDERTLVPSGMPLVPLDGRSTIPSNLPLDSIATRVVVPRDVNVEAVQREEVSHLPPQPTEMDERISIPVGAAAPEDLGPLGPISEDLVEPDIFQSGEAAFLPPEWRGKPTTEDRVTTIVSVVSHILLVLLLIFSPKLFSPHVPTNEEEEIGRRQMTVLLPPGALDALKPTAPPAPHTAVRVDPKVINKIAPPAPTPTPPPPQPVPEPPKRELPSAPTPQPNAAAVQPPPTPSPSRGELPKAPTKLENPDMPVPEKGLILPKTGNSAGDLIRDAARGTKPNSPIAVPGGSQGLPGGGGGRAGKGSHGAGIEMLTDTEGVDFNDYFHRIYYIVKGNWEAVMPPSVSLGDQGVVSLQFKIMRDGSVPDGMPIQVYGSGKEPLDRAAFSSIRASNPFPPLPAQFKGPFIELRFTYYYNIKPPNQ